MGEVYLADHPRLPRADALKVIGSAISADPSYQERFIREADLAAKLWHPNIVGVHDRGESEGQLWIAMDFVEGRNAEELLSSRYPAGMPYEDVVAIVTGVAEALDYAHKQGLVHRDIKPSNIMLADPDEDGRRRILLADFGIARTVGEVSGLTATNMTVGTVAYSAPEQLLGMELDGRADQYALAATAYRLLTGSPVFPDSNPAVVISRHQSLDPPAPSTLRPELAAIDGAFAQALAKKPGDRFARCQDFARALGSASTTTRGSPIGVSATAPTQEAPVSQRAPIPVAEPHLLPPPDRPRTGSGQPGGGWKFAAAGVAFAAVMLAFGLVVYLVARPQTTTTASDTPSVRPTTPQALSAEPPPPPASTTPTSRDATSATTSPTSRASGAPPTTVAPVSVPPPILKPGDTCPDSALAVQGITNAPVYAIGDQPKFTMVVTNIGLVACKRDVGAAVLAAYVYALDNTRLWTNLDCAPSDEALVKIFNPGEQVTTEVTWTGLGSAPQCPLPREPIGPGTYNLVVQLGNLRAAAAPFILADATAAGG
jgi:serine/threonine-protein kinase